MLKVTRCSKHQAVTGNSPPIANVMLSSEQTSFSCFLFPLSPKFFSKTIQKLLPKLSSSIVVLMTSFPSLAHPCLVVQVCLHFLGLPLCLPLCPFPLVPASSHQLLHRIIIFNVSELRYLVICTLDREDSCFYIPDFPRSLPNQLHVYIHCSRTYSAPSTGMALFWMLQGGYKQVKDMVLKL